MTELLIRVSLWISLPLNPGYPAHELSYFLEDAAAKLFFADAAAREAIEPLLPDLPALGAPRGPAAPAATLINTGSRPQCSPAQCVIASCTDRPATYATAMAFGASRPAQA